MKAFCATVEATELNTTSQESAQFNSNTENFVQKMMRKLHQRSRFITQFIIIYSFRMLSFIFIQLSEMCAHLP